MKTEKRFRFHGTNYKWSMTGWQATAIVMGSVVLISAGIYCMILLIASIPV